MAALQEFTQLGRSVEQISEEKPISLLRLSLGLVYIWFGALKLFGVSPVADMVAQTAEPLPPKLSVPLMGLLELAIGLGLLLRLAFQPTLFLLFVQLIGTFLTPIRRPERIFQNGNPLRLTKEGEFVFKNLVFLAAALTVANETED
jgi:putative oxidoreductase